MSFPALGFDPAPGDVSVIEQLVDTLTTTVDDVDESARILHSDEDGSWVGESGDAFRATLSEDFRPQLLTSAGALRQSRDALAGWAMALGGHQTTAKRLEEQAAQAEANVATRAQQSSQAADAAEAPDAAPEAAADSDAAATALAGARDELAAIRQQARALLEQVNADASATASQLASAQDDLNAYQESDWDAFWGGVGDAGAWFMDNVVPIVEDILRAALPVIAILALFPPLTGLGLAATIIAGVLVGIDALQWATGRGSFEDFAMGALGMALGGALGGLAKSVLGPGGSVVVPSIQRMTPALAGGGTAAGSLAVVLQLNFRNMVSNSYWMTNTLKGAHDNGTSFVDSLSGPWQNLFERVHNTVDGNGPRTDEELSA
ncbi:hypothetical protein [Microbacterium sp.]|uniref:hypothetical protein n=1 Tax=Microbacterium sp. TaxID=51671 RepID=UPI0028A9A61F|nr:hypothetical protein [Microbacterium sp.]